MHRTACNNSELPTALLWEQIRTDYFNRLGRHNDANDADERASFYQMRLNSALAGHLK